MIRYVTIRLALLVVAMLAASAIIFASLRVLPGDAAQLVVGTSGTPEQVRAIRASMGLDRPLIEQYLGWIGGVVRADFGDSIVTGASVASELAAKAQVTVPLALMAMTIAIVIAVPLGIFSAIRRTRADGKAVVVTAQALAAVPVVWAALMLVVLFSVWLGWFPAQGFPRTGWSTPSLALSALALPALTIGIIEGALLLRFVRSATIDAASRDWVRTAAALGLTRTQALIRHGLPSVALSVVTILGLQLAGVIVGAVVVEQAFTLPGIGRMLVEDVGRRDLTKVQGELLVFTAVVLVMSFAVDLIHRAMDPRLRDAA